MRNWDWGDTGLSLFVAAIIVLAGIGMYAAFQDHRIQFYYLSSNGAGQGHNGYCIDGYRYWWANDYGVFCSDDVEKTIAVLKQMNDGMATKDNH